MRKCKNFNCLIALTIVILRYEQYFFFEFLLIRTYVFVNDLIKNVIILIKISNM